MSARSGGTTRVISIYPSSPIRHNILTADRWSGQDNQSWGHTGHFKSGWVDSSARCLTWPPRSPDLSPVERPWDVLDKSLDGSEQVVIVICFPGQKMEMNADKPVKSIWNHTSEPKRLAAWTEDGNNTFYPDSLSCELSFKSHLLRKLNSHWSCLFLHTLTQHKHQSVVLLHRCPTVSRRPSIVLWILFLERSITRLDSRAPLYFIVLLMKVQTIYDWTDFLWPVKEVNNHKAHL